VAPNVVKISLSDNGVGHFWDILWEIKIFIPTC
jgi:hypothetical protein